MVSGIDLGGFSVMKSYIVVERNSFVSFFLCFFFVIRYFVLTI